MGRNDRAALVLRIVASLFWAGFGVVAHTPAAIIANLAAILLCMRGISLLHEVSGAIRGWREGHRRKERRDGKVHP